jgi:hypothetical protein
MFLSHAGVAAAGGPLAGAHAAGGGGGTATSGPCVRFAITNSGQTVRNFAMPDVKYGLENCGTNALAATVTVTESPGFLFELCPSPVAGPAVHALPGKQKISATAPVLRGPCGYAGSSSTRLVQSSLGWQGHNLALTVTDNATGTVLETGSFSWQDASTRP